MFPLGIFPHTQTQVTPTSPRQPDDSKSTSSTMSQSTPSNSSPLRIQQDLSALLEEVQANQSTVLDSLEEVNWRFEDANATFNLDQEAQTAMAYMEKLRTLRRVMVETRQRLARLQERSFRVRNIAEKQSEDAYREWQAEISYQRQLVAKFEPADATSTNARRRDQV